MREEITRLVRQDAQPHYKWPEYQGSYCLYLKTGNSLLVQWLGLGAFNAMVRLQSLVGELRSCKPCGVAPKNKNKNKNSIPANQCFCTCCSLCTKHSSPQILRSGSISLFRSQLKGHLHRGGFPDHPS